MSIKEFKLPDLGEGLTEGEILKWLVSVGDIVRLNQPIVAAEAPGGRTPVLVGYGPRTSAAERRPRPREAAEPAATETAVAEPVAEEPPASSPPATVLAKPPVRKLARDLGVDLLGITGSGP